jgi:hypothetical protein
MKEVVMAENGSGHAVGLKPAIASGVAATDSLGQATEQSLSWVSRVLSDKARRIRVVTLLVAIFAMSMGDLYMTVTYASQVGMIEMNPLARALMRGDSHVPIILFKLATVGISTGLLFKVRGTRVGELACWAGLVGLLWLTIRWVDYNKAMVELTPALHTLANVEAGSWVEIDRD